MKFLMVIVIYEPPQEQTLSEKMGHDMHVNKLSPDNRQVKNIHCSL